MEKGSSVRKSDYPIDHLILDRWSPRAMSGESISDEELFPLFEAARWAPSSSNIQPWRFIYAKRDTEYWDKFFNTLVEFNQMWCKNAAVLVCLVAKKKDDEGKDNYNYMSDSGAAWENLTLQAFKNDLVVHGMAGFDKDKAKTVLKISDEYQIVHMFAIGKPGSLEMIHERMRKNEKPNTERKKVSDFVFEGEFKE